MSKKKFPRLFKQTSTGKIQIWDIRVEGNIILSESGQLDGKKTPSKDIIKAGKNVGRANETTKEEQAMAEAQARWEKKLKSGYVQDLEMAENAEVDEAVEGGYLPMLAKSFDKDSKHIVFPCAVQPKLDGGRACYCDGRLWSRTRKSIISVPHIQKALNEKSPFEFIDGELYNHDFKEDFETIMHIIRQQKEPDPKHELVHYHVYDIPSQKPFMERMHDLQKLGASMGKNSPIKIVETIIVDNQKELDACMDRFLDEGYEGIMVRNLKGGYEYKRSFNLQKYKVFEDAEFKIVGVEEGRGKLMGHASAFVCITSDGNTFKAKLKGKQEALKEYLINFKKYNGKMLTVQYQGITNKNKVPRFPVGLRLRDNL